MGIYEKNIDLVKGIEVDKKVDFEVALAMFQTDLQNGTSNFVDIPDSVREEFKTSGQDELDQSFSNVIELNIGKREVIHKPGSVIEEHGIDLKTGKSY
jgi:hypothetical protein